MYSMENDILKVDVSARGAELHSIYHKGNEREYLWQGDAKWWERRSPILFPIVGKLVNNTYYVKGREYHLSQHGFARDMEFSLVEETENKLKFELRANELTMAIYPYDFKLTVSYTLTGNKVTVKYKVYNQCSELMYFSIGAHPAFNTNLTENGISDYYLDFHKNQTLSTKVLDHQVGLFTKEKHQILDNKSTLDLNYNLFKSDTLVFEGVNEVSLKNKVNNQEIKMMFKDFPLLGVWTSQRTNNCPFISLEPWHGLADYVGGPKDIVDKPYIESVLPNNKFSTQYSMEFK